ncbi:Uncharacterised protein [Streptococcus criceti]|uniref:Uncharacterized protein n=1 Tax=Streptococcus criceti HS-6 TaxID=873449 RepID=G5JP75_STRCG|nr:hypothetical protein STRCR_0310 [Streptococcus criceti HS-6]SUN41798.1 Uncharacterised protein [Streptococcus criceti]
MAYLNSIGCQIIRLSIAKIGDETVHQIILFFNLDGVEIKG